MDWSTRKGLFSKSTDDVRPPVASKTPESDGRFENRSSMVAATDGLDMDVCAARRHRRTLRRVGCHTRLTRQARCCLLVRRCFGGSVGLWGRKPKTADEGQ